MFKLLCILNFGILVTSNPLQGATCALSTYQPNYISEPPLSSNYNPYQQQNTVQYRLAPTIQTFPYSYNGQVNGYYLDNGLTNTQTSPLVNPLSDYSQDGLNLNYYNSNANKIPKVVNNYIIVPPEYISNYQVGNGIQNQNLKKNHEYVKVNCHKENAKCKREENGEARDIYSNFESKLNGIKCDNSAPKQSIRREDNKNIKTSKNAENNNQISKSSKRKKNLDVEEKDKVDNNEKSKMKMKGSKKSKKNKNSNKKSKAKETAQSILKDPSSKTDKDIFLKDKVKDDKKTADVEVCFDINEDCTRLENRKPRNNFYEPKNTCQQQFPRGFSENIASYLNNIMSDPQFSQNYLNSFSNFPYNLDYLYRIPQLNSECSNEPSKRGKNRRKNSKSNKSCRNNSKSSTRKENANKNQNRKDPSNECKVVELEPQFINIEDTKQNIQGKKKSEVNNNKTINQKQSKNREEITLEAPQLFGDTEWVQLNADDDSSELHNAPVSDDNVPDIQPELPDEYYPDFTSDKIYLSKEEYEYNFHDRHYYNSDNKAEMSIESRRYEHIDGRNSRHFDDFTDAVLTRRDKNKKQKKNHKSNILSSELEFRTPPPLLFPDFKTEMINRDSFTSRSEYHQAENGENYSDSTHDYKNPFYDLKESKPLDLGHKNQVETVFAHSKVIKYGKTPNKEEISSISSKETRKDDKNLFSTDGKTTVIIARSLGYPEEY